MFQSIRLPRTVANWVLVVSKDRDTAGQSVPMFEHLHCQMKILTNLMNSLHFCMCPLAFCLGQKLFPRSEGEHKTEGELRRLNCLHEISALK